MKKRILEKNSIIITFVAQRGIDVSMLFHNAVIIGMKLIYVKRKNKNLESDYKTQPQKTILIVTKKSFFKKKT